jgi:2-polyprenyl-6-hydroxyphenyl methylase/3-demethylubiquinone-9 3-methyltransferase
MKFSLRYSSPPEHKFMNHSISHAWRSFYEKLPKYHVHKVEYVRNVILSRTRTLQNYSLLDIGCGTGLLFTIPLAIGLLPFTNLKIRGLDVDRSSIELAESSAKKLNLRNISFDTQPVESVCANFDFVCCIEVLEHLHEPADMIKQVHNFLEPNGIFIVSSITVN